MCRAPVAAQDSGQAGLKGWEGPGDFDPPQRKETEQ